MEKFDEIINKINGLKELDKEVGNDLHEQFNTISGADWTREEATLHVRSEYDLVEDMDKDSAAYRVARAIQSDMINFFGGEHD